MSEDSVREGPSKLPCPSCGASESRVVASRPRLRLEAIVRRRECLACGGRFTTYEILYPPHRAES